MSGLGGFNTGGNATFLRIGMGVDEKGRPRAIIGKRAKDGDPGAVPVLFKDEPVLDKDGAPIYRTEHAFIEGVITKIERDQPEFNGKKVDVLNLHFNTASGMYCLQLTKGDNYWGDLAYRLPNIDLSQSVKLAPFSIAREDNPDKRNKYLVAYQGGGKVEKAWNKDSDPAAAPPAPYFDENENKWMWGKRNKWLDEHPIQDAIDKVKFLNEQPTVEEAAPETALDAAAAHATAKAQPAQGADPFLAPITGDDESDLNF